VEENVSFVSRIPGVRRAMVAQQQRMAQEGGVVMVGRDIGTVVLPKAPLKIFLVASPEERARRRYEELRAQGKEIPYEDVLQDMERRDEIDSHRSVSPLNPAPDAVIIETDGLNLEQVLKAICRRMTLD
jgi:cytidylate kinase